MNRDTFGMSGRAGASRGKQVKISVEGVGASQPALSPQEGGNEVRAPDINETTIYLE